MEEQEKSTSKNGSRGYPRDPKRKDGWPEKIGPSRVSLFQYPSDEITQAEIAQGSLLQAMAWDASETSHRYNDELKLRISHGATVESGPLEFDGKLKMVRTKKIG